MLRGRPQMNKFIAFLTSLHILTILCTARTILKRCSSERAASLRRLRSNNRRVRQHHLAAALRNQVKMLGTDQRFQLRNRALPGDDVGTIRLEPEALELRIVDEHIGSARGISSIFQIEKAPVAQQSGAVCIEK